MIEYCQAQYESFEGVCVRDKTGAVIMKSKEGEGFIQLFNQLGKDSWKMCGQAMVETKYNHHSNIYYFMREVE